MTNVLNLTNKRKNMKRLFVVFSSCILLGSALHAEPEQNESQPVQCTCTAESNCGCLSLDGTCNLQKCQCLKGAKPVQDSQAPASQEKQG